MKYAIYVHSSETDAAALANALKGQRRNVTYYVVGVDDDDAFASILTTGKIDPTLMVGKIRFIESIGKPDGVVSEAQLRALAEGRLAQLEGK